MYNKKLNSINKDKLKHTIHNMSTMFEQNGYSITTSLNERNIYIKCVDQINFTNYETNLDQKEIRLQISLDDIHNIINNCFKSEQGYNVNFNVSSGSLKLTFNALVGGFLKLNFEALLREKILSNDGQLTMKFNTMEQKYEALAKKFEKFIEKYEDTQEEILRLMDNISNAEIILSPRIMSSVCTIFPDHIYKINSTEIKIECAVNRFSNNLQEPSLDRVNEFYQLKKLTINFYRFHDLTKMKNKTIDELRINAVDEGHFKSILGINNFPNLRKIEFYSAPSLSDIVKILSEYKHNIKTIIISRCPTINVVELQTYCQVNNIQLNIS